MIYKFVNIFLIISTEDWIKVIITHPTHTFKSLYMFYLELIKNFVLIFDMYIYIVVYFILKTCKVIFDLSSFKNIGNSKK